MYETRSTASGEYATEDYAVVADTDAALTAADVGQKVIKTGDIDITVGSTADAVVAIGTLGTSFNGFTASSSVHEDVYGNTYGSITIRIPSESFDEAMGGISALADKINSEYRSGQDVTEDYIDIAARLTAAQAQEAQYLVVLQSAETVGDVLAVQEHLAEVRASIESLEGQIAYLNNKTSLATINVTLTETSRITVPVEKFVLGDVVRDATRTLILVGQSLLAALVWLAIVGLPLLLVAYGVYRVVRLRTSRR